MLSFGQLKPHLAEGALPREALVLSRLHGGSSGLEFVLGDARLLACLDQLPLQALRLGRGATVRVTRLAPLLPDDAAAQELESRCGFGCLAGGSGLDAQRIEPRSQL